MEDPGRNPCLAVKFSCKIGLYISVKILSVELFNHSITTGFCVSLIIYYQKRKRNAQDELDSLNVSGKFKCCLKQNNK